MKLRLLKSLLVLLILRLQLSAQDTLVYTGSSGWLNFRLLSPSGFPWPIARYNVPASQYGWNYNILVPPGGIWPSGPWRTDAWPNNLVSVGDMWCPGQANVRGALFRKNFNLSSIQGQFYFQIEPNNEAEVYINGIKIGGVYNWTNGPIIECIPSNIFHPGTNLVAMKVTEYNDHFTFNNFVLIHNPDPQILYVDRYATGNNSGLNWANAMTDLQVAMNFARSNNCINQIWVSAGDYYADPVDPNSSFELPPHIGIYGGFDADNGDVNWEDRDWFQNGTRLMIAPGTGTNIIRNDGIPAVERDAILDGFIMNGNIFGTGTSGGVIYLDNNNSPTIRNCKFQSNMAPRGAVINCVNSSPRIENCWFNGNVAIGSSAVWANGGSIYSFFSEMEIMNCLFISNGALNDGGSTYAYHSKDKYTNCTFHQNISIHGIGGAVNAQFCGDIDGGGQNAMHFINCIFNANRADTDPVYKNIFANGDDFYDFPIYENCNIVDDEPWAPYSGYYQFTLYKGDYRDVMNQNPLFNNSAECFLTVNSPCRETGNNNYITNIEYDFFDKAPHFRLDYCNVDMGYVEFVSNLACSVKPNRHPDHENYTSKSSMNSNTTDLSSTLQKKGISTVSLVPNPTQGKFRIIGLDLNLSIYVVIRDLLGNIIVPKHLYDNGIDLTNQSSGIYIVEIMQGSNAEFKRIIKE